jgi:hypothetical protein
MWAEAVTPMGPQPILSTAGEAGLRGRLTGALLAADLRLDTSRLTPGIVGDWQQSLHAKENVACADCHVCHAFSVAQVRQPENADARRENMKEVCGNCHSRGFVDNFYQQYDSLVVLYNEKFAVPATDIMNQLKADGLITPSPFDDEIEWTYFELWHHEGRRARHGASMSGPDYAWWHGLYEVSKNFYNEFLPQAEHLKPGISDSILASEHHKWRKGLDPEEIQNVLRFFRERYGQ